MDKNWFETNIFVYPKFVVMVMVVVVVELVGVSVVVSVVVLVILEVEEVVVVVAEGVVGVVVLLVVAAFPIEGGRGGHSTIEVIIPLVRSVPPPEYFFPQ